MTQEIKALGRNPDIVLLYFPFENLNRKAQRANKPSELTVDTTFITADDDRILISDTAGSELFPMIAQIIGKHNRRDVQHVDTAYKEGCAIFVSPDRDDIISKADKLEKLTSMKFFYSQDFQSIRQYVEHLLSMEPGGMPA